MKIRITRELQEKSFDENGKTGERLTGITTDIIDSNGNRAGSITLNAHTGLFNVVAPITDFKKVAEGIVRALSGEKEATVCKNET